MDVPPPPRVFSRWDLAFLAGMLVLGGLYARILPRLPALVPTHFDALGRANGWTAKDQLPWVAFGIPVFLWTVLLLIGAITARLPAKLGGRSAAPSIQPLRGLLGLGICLTMAGCLLVPLQGLRALFAGVLACFVCMVLGVVFMVRDAWDRMSRAPRSGPLEHVRCGVFYVDPEDPRLWVEKPVGVGWTLNFGRPAAPWVLLLILAGTVGLVLVVRALV
jgi:uncharacterized membrane protein